MTQEINDALLDKLLGMARLDLSKEERKTMKKELNRMTEWLQKLREVDTEGVAPMVTMTTETNRLREDIPEKPLDIDQALSNAPNRSSHYFQTPAVKKTH